MAPAPGQPFTPLRLGLDHHARAREAERPESRHEPLGQRLRRERGGLDVHRRWIELGDLDELRGRRRGRRGEVVVAASEPVRACTGRSEAAEHGAVGQRRERAQRAQAEPDEQVGQLRGFAGFGVLEHRHRPRREKPR